MTLHDAPLDIIRGTRLVFLALAASLGAVSVVTGKRSYRDLSIAAIIRLGEATPAEPSAEPSG